MYRNLQQFQRPFRFGLVGISGVLVNTVMLWALVYILHLPLLLASVLATEGAILSNFALNDRWTFQQSSRRDHMLMRLARFNGVALGGMLLTVVILSLLSRFTGLHLLVANLLAILGSLFWNYSINSRWTWRDTRCAQPSIEVSGRNLSIQQEAEVRLGDGDSGWDIRVTHWHKR